MLAALCTTILKFSSCRSKLHLSTIRRCEKRLHQHQVVARAVAQHRLYDLGADGFVFGILNDQNQINRSACQQLISITNGKPCVFHRAFDLLPNAFTALEELIELGFAGLLSSGSPTTAIAGLDTLKSVHLQAQNRIQIVAGGGIRANNIATLIDLDLQWFHSAAWDKEKQLLDEQELVEMLKKIQQLAAD